jgi:hypothetical protein
LQKEGTSEHQVISITLDSYSRVDKNIIDASLSPQVLKSIFLLGWGLYTNKVDEVVEKMIHQNMHEELTTRYQKQISDLKSENLSLAKIIADKQELLDTRHELEIEKQKMKIEQLQHLLHEAENRVRNMYVEMHSDGVHQLKEMVKERDLQIQMLKSTNAAKGIIGESMVIHALQDIFNDAHIQHTGKTAHACDVKMTMHQTDTSLLFEVKYKGHIEKKDVVKFEEDIQASSDDVKGGMFVSILSKNIPTKGSFSVEILAKPSSKPIMYVAYADQQEFDMLFKYHCNMLKSLSELQNVHVVEDFSQMIIENCTKFQNILKRGKKKLDDLKLRFDRYIGDVDEDYKTSCELFENMLLMLKKPQIFQCCECMKLFKTQRTLDNHKCSGLKK